MIIGRFLTYTRRIDIGFNLAEVFEDSTLFSDLPEGAYRFGRLKKLQLKRIIFLFAKISHQHHLFFFNNLNPKFCRSFRVRFFTDLVRWFGSLGLGRFIKIGLRNAEAGCYVGGHLLIVN